MFPHPVSAAATGASAYTQPENGRRRRKRIEPSSFTKQTELKSDQEILHFQVWQRGVIFVQLEI